MGGQLDTLVKERLDRLITLDYHFHSSFTFINIAAVLSLAAGLQFVRESSMLAAHWIAQPSFEDSPSPPL